MTGPVPSTRSMWTAVRLLVCLTSSLCTHAFVSKSPSKLFHKQGVVSSRYDRTLRLQAVDKNDDSGFFSADPKKKSAMPGYIASFLEKSRGGDDGQYTHMIGFPMENCHELLLQLESVQRAVIYHCPVLVRASIVPVMTRLPMIYVDARASASSSSSQQDVTKILYNVVKRVVKKRINVKVDNEQEDDNDIDPLDETEYMRGPNKEGYRPLVLTFEKLEMDGDDNNVLLTTAKDDSNTEALRSLQTELRQEIEALGYKTALPPDLTSDTPDLWRPRIPFMRLPDDFKDNLPEIEADDEVFRKPEQGGNGISPIFWCQWWDDVFSQNTRLRDIGIYARQPTRKGLNEHAFYYPHETVPLPKGNAALQKDEERHQEYQESRMAEAEKEIDGLVNNDDIPDSAVQEARTQLEELYKTSLNKTTFGEIEDDGLVAQVPVNNSIVTEDDQDVPEDSKASDKPENNKDSPTRAETTNVDNMKNDNMLDDWTRERIRKAVEGRGSVKAREAITAPKPPPPPMDENPVFQKYREERDKRGKEVKTVQPNEDLPPFPSREHFVGPWNLVSSPIPSEQALNVGDESKSDNIILRVDGTTFGGPVLDRENMHKAAGGTWKMFADDDETRLRIRLVVPPSKERILVMEGEVRRLMMPCNLQPTRNTFGIPIVEQAAEQAETKNYDDLLQCDGKIWVEDAITGANRNELGEFALMKVDNQNPGDYVITIPRSVRNQD